MKMEAKVNVEKSVLPPPPPPLPRSWAWTRSTGESITNQEIAKFWRKKRLEEEEHLLAAIKAAARMRARNFSEYEYKQFIESLEDEDTDPMKKTVDIPTIDDENCVTEIRIGIKDWWTKSKYAYLNQPAIGSDRPRNRASSLLDSGRSSGYGDGFLSSSQSCRRGIEGRCPESLSDA